MASRDAGRTASPSGVDTSTGAGRGARDVSKFPIASATGVGSKVLDAAHSFAALTDFEATGSKAGTVGTQENSVIGQVVYKRLRQLDKDYLQPMFGRGEGEAFDREHDDKADNPPNTKGNRDELP